MIICLQHVLINSMQPNDPLVQIDITLTVPRQIGWLLAGVAIGHLHTFGCLIEKVGHVLRALTG